MMPPSPLRVAVAGLGFGRNVILPALRATESTTPTCLWHPDPQKSAAVAQAEDLQGFSDFSALLENDHVDGVVIATPPAVRAGLARQAMAAGKPVFLEKPVAPLGRRGAATANPGPAGWARLRRGF